MPLTQDHILREAQRISGRRAINWETKSAAEEILRIFPQKVRKIFGTYRPGFGYFALEFRNGNSAAYEWIHCREVFERHWSHEYRNSTCYPGTAKRYSVDHLLFCGQRIKSVATLIREMEIDYLHLDELSKFEKANVHTPYDDQECLYMKPSPFWYDDPCRISFLTLFLRYGQHTDKVRNVLNDQFLAASRHVNLLPSFEVFLSGRTRIAGQWNNGGSLTSNRFWIHEFNGQPQEVCMNKLRVQ